MSDKEVKREKKFPVWGVVLFAALLLVDLVTKIAAQAYFSRENAPSKIEIIPGWLNLCITYNRGIAYGIGDTASEWLKLLVVFGTGAMMIGLGVVFFRLDDSRRFAKIAIVFIVAGGLGNFIDRVYYRVWDASTASVNPLVADGVRDMVDLSRFGFAVCNFADFFITGGAVALVLALMFFDKDAVFPVGKYKALAKAAEEAQKQAENEGAENAEEGQGEVETPTEAPQSPIEALAKENQGEVASPAADEVQPPSETSEDVEEQNG